MVNGGVITPMNATVGDRVIVKVVNMLAVPISIHFHGILHHATNTMDGVDGTTQRDIMPRGGLCGVYAGILFFPLASSKLSLLSKEMMWSGACPRLLCCPNQCRNRSKSVTSAAAVNSCMYKAVAEPSSGHRSLCDVRCCPRLPHPTHAETFTYNFVTETAGTYWWHSHHHAQYMDGLLGSLTVMEPTEIKYAADQVVFVQDW